MKPSKIQKCLCDTIRSHVNFWKYTNDITSPTHTSDIEEDCLSLEEEDIIDDKKRVTLEHLLKELYWFIREFDNKE